MSLAKTVLRDSNVKYLQNIIFGSLGVTCLELSTSQKIPSAGFRELQTKNKFLLHILILPALNGTNVGKSIKKRNTIVLAAAGPHNFPGVTPAVHNPGTQRDPKNGEKLLSVGM